MPKPCASNSVYVDKESLAQQNRLFSVNAEVLERDGSKVGDVQRFQHVAGRGTGPS